MENIKLIALDIGGTLLTDRNTISDEDRNTILEANKSGIKITLVTARMYSSTKYISSYINAKYGVFGNGSHIVDIEETKSIFKNTIPTDLIKELIIYGKQRGLYIHLNEEFYETSDEKKYFALKHLLLNETYPDYLKSNIRVVDNLLEHIERHPNIIKTVYVSDEKLDEVLKDIKRVFGNRVCVTEYNVGWKEHIIGQYITYIELGTVSMTKADGLSTLTDHLGLNPNEVLVIGDGNNDIEMFKRFSNSGCMVNGSEEAKKNANFVSTKDNNNSGVSEIIRQYVKRR